MGEECDSPRATVLAAITPAEMAGFFPEPLWEKACRTARRVVIVDPVCLSTTGLAREVERTQCDVLIAGWKTPPLPAVVPPPLRYVCYLAGSVKRLVTRSHLEQGLLVTNWGSSISRVVAEGALLHILSGLRRAAHWTLAMHHDGAWKDDQTETLSLFGRRVGLHGFGRVAKELIRLIEPFGASIGVHAPAITPDVESRWKIRSVPTLEELFSGHDVIVELAPLIPATRQVVRETHLRSIPDGGVFVNVGRGDLVDEQALVKVAREGRLQFGLDVFSEEPLPAAHPLRGLRNVMLTPHLAGPTSDRRRDAGGWALKNLQAYAAGQNVASRITLEVFDQST